MHNFRSKIKLPVMFAKYSSKMELQKIENGKIVSASTNNGIECWCVCEHVVRVCVCVCVNMQWYVYVCILCQHTNTTRYQHTYITKLHWSNIHIPLTKHQIVWVVLLPLQDLNDLCRDQTDTKGFGKAWLKGMQQLNQTNNVTSTHNTRTHTHTHYMFTHTHSTMYMFTHTYTYHCMCTHTQLHVCKIFLKKKFSKLQLLYQL